MCFCGKPLRSVRERVVACMARACRWQPSYRSIPEHHLFTNALTVIQLDDYIVSAFVSDLSIGSYFLD
jgi:hypothetical protein